MYHLQPFKQMKYSSVKLTKCVQNLYAEKYNTDERDQIYKKMQDILWSRKTQYKKDVDFPQTDK